jgi:hypothetical protein
MAAQAVLYMSSFAGGPAALPPYGGGGQMEQPGGGFDQHPAMLNPFAAPRRESKEFSDEERDRRERAKRANSIFRQACSDAGLKSCFFSDFAVWSEYVAGNMTDADFHVHAETRARQMALDSEN